MCKTLFFFFLLFVGKLWWNCKDYIFRLEYKFTSSIVNLRLLIVTKKKKKFLTFHVIYGGRVCFSNNLQEKKIMGKQWCRAFIFFSISDYFPTIERERESERETFFILRQFFFNQNSKLIQSLKKCSIALKQV